MVRIFSPISLGPRRSGAGACGTTRSPAGDAVCAATGHAWCLGEAWSVLLAQGGTYVIGFVCSITLKRARLGVAYLTPRPVELAGFESGQLSNLQRKAVLARLLRSHAAADIDEVLCAGLRHDCVAEDSKSPLAQSSRRFGSDHGVDDLTASGILGIILDEAPVTSHASSSRTGRRSTLRSLIGS